MQPQSISEAQAIGEELEKLGLLTKDPDKVRETQNRLFRIVEGVDRVPEGAEGVIDRFRQFADEGRDSVIAAGGDVNDWKGMVEHTSRLATPQAINATKKTRGFLRRLRETGSFRAAPVDTNFSKQRAAELDIVGGSAQVDEFFHDTRLAGPNRTLTGDEAVETLMREGYGVPEAKFARERDLLELQAQGPLDDALQDELRSLQVHRNLARNFANRLKKVDQAFVEDNQPFWENPLFSAYKSHEAGVMAGENISSVQRHLGRAATLASENATPVSKALDIIGVKGPNARIKFLDELVERGDAGLRKQASSIRTMLVSGEKELVDQGKRFLDQIHIPNELIGGATETTKFLLGKSDPAPVMEFLKQITNTFKGFVTSPFSKFHIRNGQTIGVNHFIAGAFDPRHSFARRWMQPFVDSRTLLSGGEMKGANEIPGLEGLGNVEASRQFAREAGADLDLRGMSTEIVGEAAEQSLLDASGVESLLGRIPGRTPKDVLWGFQAVDAQVAPRTGGPSRSWWL